MRRRMRGEKENVDVQSTWKEYFEDLYDTDTEELVVVSIWFLIVRRDDYVGEVEVNGEAGGKDEKEKMVESGDE